MNERILGNLTVSEIGMGCMSFSHDYGDVMFYPGHNEQIVGKAIEPFRKEVVLATKLHIHPEEYGSGVTLYDAIHKHLEKSMKNLRTDYMDLY